MFCVENYLFHIESWINVLLHFSVFPMTDLFLGDLIVELLLLGVVEVSLKEIPWNQNRSIYLAYFCLVFKTYVILSIEEALWDQVTGRDKSLEADEMSNGSHFNSSKVVKGDASLKDGHCA